MSPSNGLLQYAGSCFKEVGNFKRDQFNGADTVHFQDDTTVAGHPRMSACLDINTVAGVRLCTKRVNDGGTRTAGMPDPLLGFDLFFGANMSLKNPNYRSVRCGACHNAPGLTDHTSAFTVKAMELDAFKEFEKGNPVVEPLIEPLIRERVISGFLLESEIAEPGQDAIERRAPNLSLVPAPVVNNNGNCLTANCSGYVFPDAITAAVDGSGQAIIHSDLGTGPVAGAGVPVPFTGFGGAFLDNGVYNIGVRPCVADQTHVTGACEDLGRGNTDPFGWPLSFAALLMKNFGGPAQQPGVAIAQFNPSDNNAGTRGDAQACAPYCSSGGLLQMSPQDQAINPGYTDEVQNPQLPPYLAPFANRIPVGDAHPQIDEGCGPAAGGCPNTLMDVANEEGFPEIGFDPRAHLSEVLNNTVAAGDSSITSWNGTSANLVTPATMKGSLQMGTWPVVNKVNRFGSFKAPQLREIELTGPYFHNGGKLTLRQVIDFYVRGGDFPVTNSAHRDFNIFNLKAELQSDLSEDEQVALVDYMLELTDERVAREAAPFDHPQMILPLDGTAPESDGTVNRDVMLGGICTPSTLAPGATACTSLAVPPVGATGPLFLNIPATGAAGNGPTGSASARVPNFLGIAGAAPDSANSGGRQRLVGAAAFCATITSQYCH